MEANQKECPNFLDLYLKRKKEEFKSVLDFMTDEKKYKEYVRRELENEDA